ncbi:hypothetical protein JCM5353_003572 [Sporobolomyces roseus]
MNFLSSNPISTERATRIKQQREAKANSHPSLEAEGAHSTKNEGRGRRERDNEDPNLSPWQGIDSPTSSDFEQLQRPDSDVEIVFHDIVQQQQRRPLSDYARSISRRGRDRSLSVEEELELGRGVEGDDEDSSAFEDAGDDGRGRGRTRERRRDPELKRSLLEDALRSSLSTILSLAPAATGMSQTPQMSHVSLASLFSSPRSATQTPPSQLSFTRPFPPNQRPSPFASSLAARFEDDEEEDQPDFKPSKTRTPSQDIPTVSSSSEDDDPTELSLYPNSTSRAIPIPRTLRTNSSDFFQPSRPLGSASISAGVYQSSDSPPVYSRRRGARRGRGSARGRGIEAGDNGGGGNSLSPQPGPASLEERRRARMEAARSGWTMGERGGTTDVEDETVQPDEAFAELLSAARFFSDLSPRASHTTRSLPNSFDSSRTSRPQPPTQPYFSPSPVTFTSLPSLARRASTEAGEEEEEEDPALASESVPTLGGLSSGSAEDGSQSPVEKASPVREDEKEEKKEKKRKKGWLEWLGIGLSPEKKTVELGVWHFVGICGVLIGVGWSASHLIRHYLVPTAINGTKHYTTTSMNSTRFEFAPIPQAVAQSPRTGGGGSMSALFL